MSQLALKLINENKFTKNATLDLGNCELSELPNELFDCIWLEELNLSNSYWDLYLEKWIESSNEGKGNILSAIPFGMSKLIKLKTLRANGNPDKNWYLWSFKFLENLSSLELLDLSYNIITNIDFLKNLTALRHLDLRNNGITNIKVLENHSQLEILDLSANRIVDIQSLESLEKLQDLDLALNNIQEVSLSFFEKIRLEPSVKALPPFGYLNFYRNPLLNIPEEVFNLGREAIIEHLSGDLKPLNECKLIFVGDGGVGKTSLMRRVVFEDFYPNEKTTHGINKVCWEVKNDNDEIFKVNLWDFGGQHIQHSLHQFFFTQRVIYVLLLNPRNDEKAAYWLEQVEKLGKESTVIIVYNWKDERDKDAKYLNNFHELRKKYPALLEPFLVSCETGDGIEVFKQKLKTLIFENESFKTKYRKEWFNIKKLLEEQVDVETNYIEYSQYEKWCNNESYNGPEKRKDLLRILNSVGSIVYFDKPILDSLQILNPEWITTGAYAILTSRLTNENKGDLSWNDLKSIFQEEKTVFSNKEIKIKYEENHFRFIIDLMLEYRLLQKNPLKEQSYLIPSAFGDKPIKDDYKEIKTEGRKYRIQFEAPFEMLIMHRFIAKNIVNITGKDYWYSGIFMQHRTSNTTALVETNQYSSRIDCWILGENVLGFWETIRNDFREIFNAYHNFSFSEEVGYNAVGKEFFLPYNEMLDALKNGVNVISYHPTYKLKNINVLEVLSLFESKNQTKISMETNEGDNYNFYGEVHNHGQLGGKANLQMNSKIEIINNNNFKALKELLLGLGADTESLNSKAQLKELLKDFRSLETAETKQTQKTYVDKLSNIFKKLKNVKDWTAIGLLPAEIATKGHKMLELWESLKHLF